MIGNNNNSDKNPGGGVGRKVFFWVTVVLAVLFVIVSFSAGVFVFFVNLIFWMVFLFFLKQFAFIGKYSIWMMIIAFVVLFFVSLIITTSGDEEGDVSKKSSKESSSKTSSKELAKYNGKVLTVSSLDGKVSGKIGINYREGNSGLQVFYHIFVQDALQENTVCFTCKSNAKYDHDCRSWDKYNYAGAIGGSEEIEQKEYPVSSSMMPVFCPEIPQIQNPNAYNTTGMNAGCFNLQAQKEVVTNKFYFTTQTTFDSMEDVIAANKLNVYDAENFMVRNSCVDGKVGSSLEKMEAVEAVKAGSPMQTYDLNIGE